MDVRTVIRDDEDWCANPRDSAPSVVAQLQTPSNSENAEGFDLQDTSETWDSRFLTEDSESSVNENQPTTPAADQFRLKLNGQSLFRECPHDLTQAQCRCSALFGVYCKNCQEIFCSAQCKDVSKPIKEDPPFVPDVRLTGRGGHRQGVGRRYQQQIQRWQK